VAQVAHIIAKSKTERHGALWALLLNTGLRPQEALALKWEDLKDGKLTISRALVKVSPSRWEFGPTKTKTSRRVVSVPSGSTQRTGDTQGPPSSSDTQRWNWVWPERSDLRYQGREANRLVECVPGVADYAQAAQYVYTCRHTNASLLLAAGWPVKAVSERLAGPCVSQDDAGCLLPYPAGDGRGDGGGF
jgi:integrase